MALCPVAALSRSREGSSIISPINGNRDSHWAQFSTEHHNFNWMPMWCVPSTKSRRVLKFSFLYRTIIVSPRRREILVPQRGVTLYFRHAFPYSTKSTNEWWTKRMPPGEDFYVIWYLAQQRLGQDKKRRKSNSPQQERAVWRECDWRSTEKHGPERYAEVFIIYQ